MRLSEIHWSGPGTFDELVAWAIAPLKELDRIFDDTIEELGDNERLLFLHYDLRNRLEDLQDTFNRLAVEMNEEPKAMSL